MAAPVDAGRVGTNITATSTTWNVNYPTSIAAGDLLILWMRVADGAAPTPSGWTNLAFSSADPSADEVDVNYRVADGTESGTFPINFGTARKGACIVWRTTGGDTSVAPTISTVATGTSTTPNPGSVNISSSRDHLILWLGGWEGEQTSPPTGAPTNYTNAIGADSGIAGAVTTNCRVAGASRQLTAGPTTEDPGSWTISASDDWMAYTVAIRNALSVDADAEVSWAEVEVPFLNADAEVAWAEVEVPTADADAEVSWAELESPFAQADAEVAWSEFQVPDLVSNADAEVAWSEIEIPFADATAQVSWSEFEVPTANSDAEVAWAEFEVPTAASAAEVSWADIQIEDPAGSPGSYIQDEHCVHLSHR